MFGPFKPTNPLFGGLLWKIPYRLSRPQKLRHRRRLRRVDNIVAVLDNALKRHSASFTQQSPQSQSSRSALAPNQHIHQKGAKGKVTPEELASTVEGEVMLASDMNNPEQQERRHGRGPRQGEMVPEFSPQGVQMPGRQFLSDEAQMQGTIKLIERWKAEMPNEQEMLPKDKYTVFHRYSRGYRKGVHKIPKWTRVSQRLNPPGF